jgi:hypothetical protein
MYTILGILMTKNREKPFDDIEILYGKTQKPSGKNKHTLFLGQCQVKLNGDNAKINHCVTVNGCPPEKEDFIRAFTTLGIELPDNLKEWIRLLNFSCGSMKNILHPIFDQQFSYSISHSHVYLLFSIFIRPIKASLIF